MHVGARHRKLRWSEAVERMTERVHAIAFNVCDSTGGPNLEVAAHQGDANWITWTKRLRS